MMEPMTLGSPVHSSPHTPVGGSIGGPIGGPSEAPLSPVDQEEERNSKDFFPDI